MTNKNQLLDYRFGTQTKEHQWPTIEATVTKSCAACSRWSMRTWPIQEERFVRIIY